MVGPVPESFQVLGDLDGPLGRREKMKNNRQRIVADPGRVGQAEHLLEAHGQDGRIIRRVAQFDF